MSCIFGLFCIFATMKRFLSAAAALVAAAVALAGPKYVNPVLHRDFSDPDVCRVGEDYYMTASSFNCFPGLPILHSRDLVHWRQRRDNG